MPRRLTGTALRALCLAAALAAAPSAAATVDEAQALIDAGKARDGARMLEDMAESGDAAAQVRLGDLYRDGIGVRRNAISACDWYAQAARQGVPSAQYEAGMCLVEGRNGEPANVRAGAQLLQSAVDAGYLPAFCPLGGLYMSGHGVIEDIERGHELCRRAAGDGDVRAQATLGEIYLLGDIGLGREAEGAAWTRKAAAVGDAVSQYNLGQALWHGKGVEQDQMKAQSYFAAAANQGYPAAQFWLGRHLIRISQLPDGTVQPYEAAAAYYWLSLAERQPLAPEDQSQAAEWLAELRRGLAPQVVAMVDEKVAAWQPRKPEDSIVDAGKPAAN